MIEVSFSSLPAVEQNIKKSADEACVLIAALLEREAKKSTPKGLPPAEMRGREEWRAYHGGMMRRSWHAQKPLTIGSGIMAYASNGIHYAPYVNYGHKQEPGRFVPAIGKRLVKSWVEGKNITGKVKAAVTESARKIFVKKIREGFYKK